MTRSFRILSVITVALGLSVDAFAHHSTTYYSKEQKDFVKIEGKVVRWEYRSPHSQLYIETTDKDGKLVTWRFESTPAAWLAREGITKDSINFGVEYVYEKYAALQWSRTSNPLPSPSFDDPSRDWGIDSSDKVNTVTANLDLIKTFPKTDIRFGFDLSDGKSTYVYNLVE